MFEKYFHYVCVPQSYALKLPAESTFTSALLLMWIELTRLNDSHCLYFRNKYKWYINSLYIRSVIALM
jgi:hypothetical protein